MKTRQARFAPTAVREERARSISLSALWRGGLDAPRDTPAAYLTAAAQVRGVLCPVKKMSDANEVLAHLFAGKAMRVGLGHRCDRRRAGATIDTQLLHGSG